jgi:hypothetical protein
MKLCNCNGTYVEERTLNNLNNLIAPESWSQSMSMLIAGSHTTPNTLLTETKKETPSWGKLASMKLPEMQETLKIPWEQIIP